ncbi:LysR family transcriptional regulator [Microbacterium sp. STN6]|uniref:LysR family transcriptional regulator n=1 Tax=Microbacterium sp. STN6 TaxID=2995588 RepID=UPI002260E418|nr:LysR family transcriptional regulator [Microbacterium sp. STN6]MCX7523318.1 LysR family transcriptional regulator [Microbacterium sp. STN6]
MTGMDLNLLRTFVAIHETGSLTQAADALTVTQPSVSYGLARLRSRFDDPLFIRRKHGMQPTVLADELYGVFKQSLVRIDTTLDSTAAFDPATSRRRFRICLTDVGEMILLPPILERMAAQAPHVELEVVPMQIDLVPEWLAVGRVDAAIASTQLAGDLKSDTVLMHESYCVLVRDDFPLADGRAMSMEQFLAARHAVVTQGSGHWLAENAIEQLGLVRRSTVVLHHFSVLPHLIERCGLVAIVPRGVADSVIERWPLAAAELPFEVPSFPVKLYWQVRDRESPAIRWFHETIIAALRADAPVEG